MVQENDNDVKISEKEYEDIINLYSALAVGIQDTADDFVKFFVYNLICEQIMLIKKVHSFGNDKIFEQIYKLIKKHLQINLGDII